MGHVWFTGCGSLFCTFVSPNTKRVDNTRLAIDLSALKQIWDKRDDCAEEVEGSTGDYSRWIDTSAMLSDCLTKTMTSCRLNETLSTGIFDMTPTEESPVMKAQNQKVVSIEERAGTVARSWRLLFLVFVVLIENTHSLQVLSSSDLDTSFCHVLLCHLCVSVHFRRALESQAKRRIHISHHIGLHRFAHCALNPQ